jgi:capsule biosynthesis phosphatase
MDLDDTICSTQGGNYKESTPNPEVIKRLNEYRAMGFQIAISTSRNMRSFEGNIGKITAVTLPIIVEWLDRHAVPYDEIYVGKPWCGTEGFYVDDKAIRPDEFINKSYEEIKHLVGIATC